MNLKELIKEVEKTMVIVETTKNDFTLFMNKKHILGIKQTVEAIDRGELDFVWKDDDAIYWEKLKKLVGVK